MRRKLFTISDVFEIAGREGIVIVGNRQAGFPEIKIGSAIVLTLPDGLEPETEVSGIDGFQTNSVIKKRGFNKKFNKRRCSTRNTGFLENLEAATKILPS